VPLYEYQCGQCGRFELIQKFSDAPLTVCPTCGNPVHKLLSAPAIQFKGTGWYITDYARKSGGGESKGAKESGSPKDGGSGKDSGAASSSDSSTTSKSSSGKDTSTTGGGSK
jgi:putative FmdB family regulatory protein